MTSSSARRPRSALHSVEFIDGTIIVRTMVVDVDLSMISLNRTSYRLTYIRNLLPKRYLHALWGVDRCTPDFCACLADKAALLGHVRAYR